MRVTGSDSESLVSVPSTSNVDVTDDAATRENPDAANDDDLVDEDFEDMMHFTKCFRCPWISTIFSLYVMYTFMQIIYLLNNNTY